MAEYLASLIDLLHTLVAFVAVISIVVFVHEMGHYLVGRWRGIHAEVFSLGFGKVLFSRIDRRGTRWQLAAVPMGGYVKFLGDSNAASAPGAEIAGIDRRRTFHGASVFSRALTIMAGPAANFVLAIVVFAGLALVQGVSTTQPTIASIAKLPYDTGLEIGDVIVAAEGEDVATTGEFWNVVAAVDPARDISVEVERAGTRRDISIAYPMPPLVSGVSLMSPAERAGLQIGDLILAVDGENIGSFNELKAYITASGGLPLELSVWRNDQIVTLDLSAEITERLQADGTVTRDLLIGVSGRVYFETATRTPGIFEAVGIGAGEVYRQLSFTLSALRQIVVGNLGADNLSGPVGIARATGSVAKQGIAQLVFWVGMLSAGIGLVNLFPIPVLDGGHLVLLAVESIRRRPADARVIQIVMSVGLFLVLFMFVFVTYNDIMRL